MALIGVYFRQIDWTNDPKRNTFQPLEVDFRMLRPLFTLLAALALVAIAGWSRAAEARISICEPEEPEESRPVSSEFDGPRHSEPRFCFPGMTDDTSCWPHETAPLPTRSFSLFSAEHFVVGRFRFASHFDADGVERLRERTRLLAAGHARRIERPPRIAA